MFQPTFLNEYIDLYLLFLNYPLLFIIFEFDLRNTTIKNNEAISLNVKL